VAHQADRINRRGAAQPVGGAVIAGAAAVSGIGREVAHAGDGAGIIGAWLVQVQPQGLPPQTLVGVHHADGTVVTGGAPTFLPGLPGIEGRATFSPSVGAWTGIGEREVAFHFLELAYDEAAVHRLTLHFRGTATVATDGARFSGRFSVEMLTPAGAVFAGGSGTVHATRIGA
jgi:hypothetical protein